MLPLIKKLRIKENTAIVALHAPKDYETILGALPDGATIRYKLVKQHDFVHLFVRDKVQLEQELRKTIDLLQPGGLLWISYPKQSSGIQTDLTRDKGWEILEDMPLERLSLISFDDSWSAFLMRNTPPKERAAKASAEYHANQVQYADPVSKTVIEPDDLAIVFNKHKRAKEVYDALAYSHRKEYVLWIVGAKREETRKERVRKTIDMLETGKKNPTAK